MTATQKGLCVVIGAGPGLGLAVAKRFQRDGHPLALIARHPEALNLDGVAANIYRADAGDHDELETALADAEREQGHPEVLVYNAVNFLPGTASELDPMALTASLMVNVVGAQVALRAALDGMRARGHGTLLFTGGGAALSPMRHAAALSVGKAALRTLVLCAAQEAQGSGVKVATVTVSGTIKPGTAFDPDTIAEVYWKLHTGEMAGPEVQFRGEPT